MPIPEITHLQFLLLDALQGGERTGRALRELLSEQRHRTSGPAFYQLMARMEDARLVRGRYDQKLVEGQLIKERVYTITAAGLAAVEAVRAFYAALAERRVGLEGA
jgi:DNA-binding PadR family transcriptional regulator